MTCRRPATAARMPHGRPLPLCRAALSHSFFAMSGCGRARHAADLDGGARGRGLFGQHPIRRQISSLIRCRETPATLSVWTAFVLLVSLIAADNLLWRLAGWIASFTFVRVTGDLRRDLFRHLTGHSPSYFADRMPGMLTSRVTATSNAAIHGRKHVRLERAAALRGNVGGDRLRDDGQPADGGRAWRLSPASWSSPCSASPPPGGRCITNSPTRPQRSTARWSTSSATCRWCAPSAAWAASISRFDATDRPRDDGAPAQPALSREAAHPARRW